MRCNETAVVEEKVLPFEDELIGAVTFETVECTTLWGAKAWIDVERHLWQERSRCLGTRATDQAHPSVIFNYRPSTPSGPSVLLLGGMGPLAGLLGLEAALRRHPTRAITLYQACHLPCRSRAIAAQTQGDKRGAKAVTAALRKALETLTAMGGRDADLVVLCNTAHHFLPRMTAWLPQGIRLRGLPQAALEKAGGLNPKRLMLLSTEAARLGGLYPRAAESGGRWCQPEWEAQALLEGAIFQGVKGGNRHRLLADGEAFVRWLLDHPDPPDAWLAGCTEIPLIVEALLRDGSEVVRRYLQGIAVIDPVNEALAGIG